MGGGRHTGRAALYFLLSVGVPSAGGSGQSAALATFRSSMAVDFSRSAATGAAARRGGGSGVGESPPGETNGAGESLAGAVRRGGGSGAGESPPGEINGAGESMSDASPPIRLRLRPNSALRPPCFGKEAILRDFSNDGVFDV